MKLNVKVEALVVILTSLQHFVLSDSEFINKCPEFNPQNELDIDLVSEVWKLIFRTFTSLG